MMVSFIGGGNRRKPPTWSGQVNPKTTKLTSAASRLSMHQSLMSKREDLAWTQNNVSQCSNMSTHRLLFQWTSSIKIHDVKVNLPDEWFKIVIGYIVNHSFLTCYFIFNQECLNWPILYIQCNLSKPNLRATNFCVRYRQVFGLCRLN